MITTAIGPSSMITIAVMMAITGITTQVTGKSSLINTSRSNSRVARNGITATTAWAAKALTYRAFDRTTVGRA